MSGRPSRLWATQLASVGWVAACATAPPLPITPVAFPTATVWVTNATDSARLVVEVARSAAQQEVGLAGRTALAPDRGMLFQFDEVRTEDDGFWMLGTAIPLDILFIDASGVVISVLPMEPCVDPPSGDDCPGYFPEAPYASALEVNRGWLARHGLGVGARVRVEG